MSAAGLALILDLLTNDNKEDNNPDNVHPPPRPIYSPPRPSSTDFASFTLTKPFASRRPNFSISTTSATRNTLKKKICVKCHPKKAYRIYVTPLFAPPPMYIIINTTLPIVYLDLLRQVFVSQFLVPLVPLDSRYLIDEITSIVKLDLSTQIKIIANQLCEEMCFVFIHRVRRLLISRCFSPRVAWKLLKDPSASTARKARRSMSCISYILRVTKTTIISKLTITACSWAIRAGMRIGKLTFSMAMLDVKVNWVAVLQNERKWAVRCVTSLILPALGAGIFSAILRPKLGHSIGYRIGKFARKLKFRCPISSAFLIRQIIVDSWKWRSLPINFCITGFLENVPMELCAKLPGCNIAISLSVFELQFIWLLAVHQNGQGSEDWDMLHNWIKLIVAIGSNSTN